jgi:hypothetical protein
LRFWVYDNEDVIEKLYHTPETYYPGLVEALSLSNSERYQNELTVFEELNLYCRIRACPSLALESRGISKEEIARIKPGSISCRIGDVLR